jgi:hypothetical protein
MSETQTEQPPQPEPEAVEADEPEDEGPLFTMFAGLDPEAFEGHGLLQELGNRLAAFERNMLGEIAKLHVRLDELENDTAARISANLTGMNRATGTDPLA